MDMFRHIPTHIGALGANLSEQATETRAALKKQAAVQEKAVSKLSDDVGKKLSSHRTELCGMLNNTNGTVAWRSSLRG